MNTKIIEKIIEDKSSSDFEDISVKNEDWKYVGKNVFDINNFDTGKESKLTTNKEFNVDSNCHSHSVNNEFHWFPGEFKNHFADWKNYLTLLCNGDYIFQIDADEIPNKLLLVFL